MNILIKRTLLLFIIFFSFSVYARYYDPKLSRWVSVDPPLSTGEYLPELEDKLSAIKGNKVYKPEEELKGYGGVYNPINLNAYTNAANNPVKYIDPDGNIIIDTGNNSTNYIKNNRTVPTGNNIVNISGSSIIQLKTLSFYNSSLGRLNKSILYSAGLNSNTHSTLANFWNSASNIQSGKANKNLSATAAISIENTAMKTKDGHSIFKLSVEVNITEKGKDTVTTSSSLFYFTEKDNLKNKQDYVNKVSEVLSSFDVRYSKPQEVKVNDKR